MASLPFVATAGLAPRVGSSFSNAVGDFDPVGTRNSPEMWVKSSWSWRKFIVYKTTTFARQKRVSYGLWSKVRKKNLKDGSRRRLKYEEEQNHEQCQYSVNLQTFWWVFGTDGIKITNWKQTCNQAVATKYSVARRERQSLKFWCWKKR